MVRQPPQPDACHTAIAYIIVTVGAIVFMIPFVWMLSSSLKPLDQIFVEPPVWIPNPVQWHNYVDAWTALPFSRFLVNTLFITILIMFGNIVTSAVVGYGFARYRFPGRDVLFIVLLSTMMLPYVVTLIPTFLIWRNLQLINTYDPLVIGSLFGGGPFFIFLMRQFMLTLPVEMEEAARIDGANTVCRYLPASCCRSSSPPCWRWASSAFRGLGTTFWRR